MCCIRKTVLHGLYRILKTTFSAVLRALWLTYKVLLEVFFLNPTRVGSSRVQLEKGNLGS